jgi:hypothetical protein
MGSYYRTRLTNKPITATNVEALLRSLQEDIEQYGSEPAKQRRRLLLRGFRAGLWVGVDRPKLGELAQALRAELFGHPLPVAADEDDIRCHSGTMTEEDDDDR